MGSAQQRLAANRDFADRLIDSYTHRAGSDEPVRWLGEFVIGFADEQAALDGLAELVLTLARRAADMSTFRDIYDPHRRVDPAKAARLAHQTRAAFEDLGRELEGGQ